MDAAARGQKALDAGNLDTAIAEYTSAIASNPAAVSYYLKRSTAHQRANHPAEALTDADIATTLAYKRQKRELISEAQRRRMAVLYQTERFGDAQFVWSIANRLDENEKTLPIWGVRIQNALAKLAEGDEKGAVRVKENPGVDSPASAPDAAKKEGPATASTGPTEPAAPTKAAPAPTLSKMIRHEWYQNDQNVVVQLLAKGLSKDQVMVEIEANALHISFPTADNSNYSFSLDPLWAEVERADSTSRVTITKIEVTLRKRTQGVKWKALERPEGDPSSVESERASAPATSTAADKAPAYPTSSRHGAKNWDKVVSDEQDPEPYDEFDGDETTRFFKHLYKGCTPEQQRAMMKSYQESGGTVLSTDWSQVSSKHVDPEPPEGMVEKRYE